MGRFAGRRWQDEVQDRIVRQLSELQDQVSSLGQSVARRGGDIQDDVSDFGDAIWHGGELAARQIGREASRIGRAVRHDPLPAVVGVVALVGVVAALSIAFGRK